MFELDTYSPINVLKPVAANVWIVDGPVVRMNWLWTHIPFSTRMTIVRLGNGDLWVHSPTELTGALMDEIDALGPVRHIVAPNRIHYVWVRDWQDAYAQAVTYAAPLVAEEAKQTGAVFDVTLGEAPVEAWGGEIVHVLAGGAYLVEADFFHRPSATLILTDLIENFERSKIHGWFWRLLYRMTGVLDPQGSMPRDLRTTFWKHRGALKRAVETMISWQPERIIVAHGRCYDGHAVPELVRAFSWLRVK